MSHAGRTVSCGGSWPSSIFSGMLPLGEPGESLFGFSEASCAPPDGGTDVVRASSGKGDGSSRGEERSTGDSLDVPLT